MSQLKQSLFNMLRMCPKPSPDDLWADAYNDALRVAKENGFEPRRAA